ncbi:MAG: transposase [Desulfurococcales archaeon ex4484_42]|nr:MAG: transposase [Desulfurococcales archaeon ex4484_42]
MKAYISLAREMPEGVYRRALKAKVEVIEDNANDLLWDLAVHKYVLQKVIDVLWGLDKLPKKSQVHQLLYPMLRSYGFRAHVVRNIYKTALALVKSARENKGSKPLIRKMSARLDYQDARVEIDNGVVKVILRNKWYTLKLMHRREYIKRFKGLKWKEVHVKYYNGELYVSIVFEVKYTPYTPRGVLALDVNLRHIVTYDGSSVRRYRTRFINALSKRARAEELQRKYPKKWRYNKRVLSRIRSLHRKARNIVIDWCRKFAKEIVLKVKKHNYAIVLENLTRLHENMSKNKDIIVWKLSMLAYRKLREAIVNKAIEYNVPIAFINPRNTSSTCPRCYTKLSYDYRLAICSKCGFIADRDVVGAVNIWLRFIHAYAGEHGSPPRAPAMKDETRQSGGTRNEGMKKVIKNIQKWLKITFRPEPLP